MTKTILAGASAIALVAIANGASATTLDSGGSTLAAKVYRDIFNCYAGATASDVILATSASATEYANAYDGTPANISYPTSQATTCKSTYETTGRPAIDYLPVGSGAGQKAFTYYSPASWGLPAIGNPVAWLSDALGISTLAEASTEFDFSGSDAGLTQTQLSSAASGHGAVVQFPSLITPIDLPVNDSGSKADNVKLTTAQVCGIYGGTITNWSQITSPGNKGVNTGAITPVVRADGSGTSYIFSNYLSIVCPAVSSTFGGFTAANGFPSTSPNWSAAASGNGGTAGAFVSQSGSGGVAGYVAAHPDSIAYVSPDYVGTANGYATLPAEIQYPASSVKFVKPTSAGAAALAGGVTTIPNNAYDWGQPLNNQILAQGSAAQRFELPGEGVSDRRLHLHRDLCLPGPAVRRQRAVDLVLHRQRQGPQGLSGRLQVRRNLPEGRRFRGPADREERSELSGRHSEQPDLADRQRLLIQGIFLL